MMKEIEGPNNQETSNSCDDHQQDANDNCQDNDNSQTLQEYHRKHDVH